MKTYTLLLITILNASLIMGCNKKPNQKIATNNTSNPAFSSNNTTENQNFITINGETYNLVSDPCVLQDNDDHKMLTFKGKNDDKDYSLSITLYTTNQTFANGNYILPVGESTEKSVILILYTEDGTYANYTDTPVNYKKNGNEGTVTCDNIDLEDNFEELPNITISFNLTCALE